MRASTSLLSLLLVTGCASSPEVGGSPQSLTVAAPLAQVQGRVETAMRAEGLTPEASAEGFRADVRGAADQAWADCPRQLVRDEQSTAVRTAWAAPQARTAEVSVGLQPQAEGTRVTVSTEPSATYVDRYRNTPFEAGCASTGELERGILGAVQG